jgi:hypothetical protein
MSWVAKKYPIPHLFSMSVFMCSLFLLISSYVQTKNRIRTDNLNSEQLKVLKDVTLFIPPNEPVYDGVGSYIFRPDGYFICCHRYEQFVDKLDTKFQSLKNHLIQSKTKYIILDQKGFVFWTTKPDDLVFIITHYLLSPYKKIYTLGSAFSCDSGKCIQLTVHGKPMSEDIKNTFDIVIEETYRIRTEPANEKITIQNTVYTDTQKVRFFPGIYKFSAPSGVTGFSVQLD